MVQAQVDAYIKEHPYVTNKMMRVEEHNGNIIVSDDTGTNRFVMYPELMRKEYAASQQKLAEAAQAQKDAERAQKIADANKRAPIMQVRKAREEARKRVQENRKKVPKYIYGRKDD